MEELIIKFLLVDLDQKELCTKYIFQGDEMTPLKDPNRVNNLFTQIEEEHGVLYESPRRPAKDVWMALGHMFEESRIHIYIRILNEACKVWKFKNKNS